MGIYLGENILNEQLLAKDIENPTYIHMEETRK
jgi:hypothetical protein